MGKETGDEVMDESIILNMKSYMGRLRRDMRQKVHAPLAECYRKTGLVVDAEKTAHSGLDMFPSYLLCREVLGKIYFRQGKLEQAQEQLERVAKIIKNSPELSRVLGKLYVQLRVNDLARELLDFVLERDPFDFEVRHLLSELDLRAAGLEEPDQEEPEPEEEEETFAEKLERRVWDIETILSTMDEPQVHNHEKYVDATDRTLDALEEVEDVIDARADEIFARNIDQPEQRTVVPRMPVRPLHSATQRREISAAAAIGQVHMEIHLLDEALFLAKKLLDSDPHDPDLRLLCDKFEKALGDKESELDRVEGLDLATGL